VIVITLGIALLFVNLLMLYLTSWLTESMTIGPFGAAVGATIVVWFVNAVLSPCSASATPAPVGYAAPSRDDLHTFACRECQIDRRSDVQRALNRVRYTAECERVHAVGDRRGRGREP
jgi:hypothetical protein